MRKSTLRIFRLELLMSRRLVYLSRLLSDKEKPLVEAILSEFAQNIEYTTNQSHPDLALRVINTSSEFGCRMNSVCLSVALSCLQDMKRKKINPFEFQTSSNVLKNLSLYQQRLFLSLKDTKHEKRLQTLIGAMGGTVVCSEEDADFVITDDGRRQQNEKKNVVHSSWIDALMKRYKTPTHFKVPLSLSMQPSSQRLALTQVPQVPQVKSVRSMNNPITRAFKASPHVVKARESMFELEVSAKSSQSTRPSQEEDLMEMFAQDEEILEVKTQPERKSPKVESPPTYSPSQGAADSPRLNRLCEKIMRVSAKPAKQTISKLSFDDLVMFSQNFRDDDDQRCSFDVKYDIDCDDPIDASGDKDPLLDFFSRAKC